MYIRERFMIISLKKTTVIFLGLLMLSNLFAIGYLIWSNQRNNVLIAAAVASNERISGKISPLGSLIKDAQIDVIQVQQFLQDYSSTRGEDGLADGLEEAAKYAEKFRADIDAATVIATTIRRDDVVTALKDAANRFGPYFTTGEQMAKTYAAQGTSAGNAMMPAFDERSEALQEKLKALLSIRDEMLSTTATDVAQQLETLQADVSTSAVMAITAAAFVVLVSLAWAWTALRHIVRPIGTLADVLRDLSAGHSGVVVPFLATRNEIGDIARATDVFRESIAQREQMRRAAAQEEERSRQARRQDRLALADDFAARVASVVDGLGVAADRIGQDARAVDLIARAAAQRSEDTNLAMTRASGNVAVVADAVGMLSGAIDDVDTRMHRAASISADASEQARKTHAIVADLAESTSRIGEIVGLINAVASQTNLLALNATIEAARAGEAGRGFAVVAQEVKALAAQTSKATEDIAHQIAAVQSATGSAVQAITGINETVAEIGGVLGGITEAVTEQTTATREIARSIDATTVETRAMAGNIRAVDEDTRRTTAAAVSMVSASDDLASVADRLRVETSAFVERMRA